VISPRLVALLGYGGPNARFPAIWFAEADDTHLTDEERRREESLRQGVSPIRFVPLRSCEPLLASFGGAAGSGKLHVDAHPGCVVSFGSAWARAQSRYVLPVQCGRVVRMSGFGAIGGTTHSAVLAGAAFRLSGAGARAAASPLFAAGAA